jgi:hypothetical protein
VKQIEITVSPQGEPRIETKGFSGSECRDASRFVEQALGHRLDEQLTPEFYAPQSQQQHQREGQ